MNVEDASEVYEQAVERCRLLAAEWQRLKRLQLATGSMGQLVVHPLLPALNAAETHAARLRQRLRKSHAGPAPSAVVTPLESRRIRRKQSA